jgi:CRISPR system Cascade subunit CasD
MPQYLTFQLYGPFAAYGSVAVGEVRSTAASPAKSAILGLVAGALGIDRYDNDTHRRMAETYRLAVRMDAPGRILRDFHTIQSCTPAKGFSPGMRREELGPGVTIQTITSRRDYLNDAVCMVCLKPTEEALYSLNRLKDALQQPVYIPYVGRKSCPLGLPLSPRIEEAPSFEEALRRRPPDRRFLDWIVPRGEGESEVRARFFWEDEEGSEAGQILPRRDVPLNRRSWQFAEREEKQGDIELP